MEDSEKKCSKIFPFWYFKQKLQIFHIYTTLLVRLCDYIAPPIFIRRTIMIWKNIYPVLLKKNSKHLCPSKLLFRKRNYDSIHIRFQYCVQYTIIFSKRSYDSIHIRFQYCVQYTIIFSKRSYDYIHIRFQYCVKYTIIFSFSVSGVMILFI